MELDPPDPSEDVGHHRPWYLHFVLLGIPSCPEVRQQAFAFHQLRLSLIARTCMARTKMESEGSGLGFGRPHFWVALSAVLLAELQR